MPGIFSSLYNRVFGASDSAEAVQQNQETSSSSRTGFFSGWSISFLFGSRPNRPSLLQRIFPWFFSTNTFSEDTGTQNPNFLYFVSQPSASRTERALVNYEEQEIYKTGSWSINAQHNPKQIAVINKSLLIDEFRETGDRHTFAQDAERNVSWVLLDEKGATTLSTADLQDSTTEQKPSLVQQAIAVIITISDSLFPSLKGAKRTIASTNLESDLKLLNPQGLIAASVKLFNSNEAPDGVFFPLGGLEGDIIYQITRKSPPEITITINGTISSTAKVSALCGKLKGEIMTISSDKQTAEGKLAMTLKAKIGSDGQITSLTCQSASGSYLISDN